MTFHASQKTRDRLLKHGRFLVTDVSFDAMEQLTDWILSNRPEKNRFTILINSAGGKAAAVLVLSSFLRTLEPSVRLTGVAFGVCGSAALALLQCCHERIGVKECGFFIHNMQGGIDLDVREPNWKNARIHFAARRAVEDEIIDLQIKRTGMSKKQWLRLAAIGQAIPGRGILCTEAKKIGLIDKIVDRYPVF